jgi:hypothetical protein
MVLLACIHRIDSRNPYFGVGKTRERKYYFSHDISPRQLVELPDKSGDIQ